MRTSRRTFLATSAGGAGIAILAACGAVPATTTEVAASAEEPQKEAMEAPEEKKILPVTFWYHSFPAWNFDTEELPKALRAQFDETSGYKMIPLGRPNGGFNDVQTVVAAGTAPDVVKTQSWVQNEWGVLEIVQPLDPWLGTAQNIQFDDLWKEKLNATQYQGKTHALSYSIDARIIFSNTDQYLEAGLDPENPPQTWADMEDAVTKTFKQTGDQIEVLSWDPFRGSGGVHTWMVPYWQLGGEIFNEDKTKFTVSNELAVEALTWLMRIYDLQGGWPSIAPFHTDKRNREQMANGEMTHYYEGNAVRNAFFRKFHPDFEFHYFGYPLPSAAGVLSNYSGDWAFCMPNGSANPDGGFAVIDFFYDAGVNLEWSNVMDRIPVRKSVAESADYIQDDPFKVLIIKEMDGARFVASVPGARGILGATGEAINSVRNGEATIPDALQLFQDKGQSSMDEFLSNQ